ncbi:MAG: hypothetical protein FWD65_00595 [Coriobacteriia bacterium]|nr:hypothetical protein [Coriobacteriia bacterium]
MRSGVKLRAAIIALALAALIMPSFFPESSASAETGGLNAAVSQNTSATPPPATSAAPASASTLATDTGALADQVFLATVYNDASLTKLVTGSTVRVSGELPVGGYAVAFPVDLPPLADADVLVAYDIAVYRADGAKYMFDNSLKVTIDVPDMPADVNAGDLSLVYLSENNQQPETLMTPVSVTDSGVSFDVEHFSTYAIILSSVTAATLNGGAINLTQTTTPIGNLDFSYILNDTSLASGGTSDITVKVNSNLTIWSMVVNNVPSSNFTSGGGGTAGPVTYGMDTQIVLTCRRGAGTPAEFVTVTINIKTNTQLQIADTIMTDGKLNAAWSGAGTVASYTWYKSSTLGGPYTEVTDPEDAQPVLFPGVDDLEGGSVNVALDGGAQMYYKVVATLSDDSQVESASYQVPYYTAIQNGGFENPPGTTLRSGGNANYSNFTDGTVGLCWHTTSQDLQIEMNNTPPLSIYNVAPAEGLRFAELNANYEGTLYQDVLVTPGESLSWSLAHAGRLATAPGEDTMYVVIMPTTDVDLANIPQNAPGSPNKTTTLSDDERTSVTTIIDANGSWNNGNGGADYTGEYTVPDGVYVVRFLFVSGNTAGNNKTQGNLLDKVVFNADMTYTIEYYVNGELQTASTETGRAPAKTLIMAQHTGDFTDYTLQRSVLIDKSTTGTILPGSTDLKRATQFTLTEANSVLRLYYVTQGIFVNKEVDGLDPGDMPTGVPYIATFGLYDNHGTLLSTAIVTMTGGDITGSMQFFAGDGTTPIALEPDTTYTIKEISSSDLLDAGYTWTSTVPLGVTKDSGSDETTLTAWTPYIDTQSMTFTTPPAAEATKVYQAYFSNTYRRSETTLTLSKVVEGAFADQSKKFTFTVTLTDSHGDPIKGDFPYVGGLVAGVDAIAPDDGTLSFDENGVATIELSHGQSITVQNVLVNDVIQIKETEDPDYKTSIMESGPSPVFIDGNDTGKLTLSHNPVYAFTNEYKPVVPSGVDAGSSVAELPILLLAGVLACVITAGSAWAGRRKLKRGGG